MRITQSMLTRNLLNSLNSSKEALDSMNNHIASGKRIEKVSDDPLQFIAASRFKQAMSRNDQYLKNITNGTIWTDVTSNVLENFNTQLMDLKTQAMEVSGDDAPTDARAALAQTVDGILQEMITMANSKQLDSYVFAGAKTGTEPFQYDGSAVTYSGDNGAILRKIDNNSTIAVNLSGQALIDSAMFESVINLKNALAADDTAAVGSSIDGLTAASEQMVSLTTRIASVGNRLNLTHQQLETANLNLASYLSQSEDVDMAEVITKYNSQQIAYQAALQTMSDVMHTNIMDYLK